MTRLDTLFFDLGGVCLTNGWDNAARLAAASHFVLDVEEIEDRHQARAAGLERGELSLNAYFDHVVFHRDRTFSRDAFIAFMRSR
jgi:putative hydrolase of the HAD superfamily